MANKQQVDQIIAPGWLIPVNERRECLVDHAIVISGRKILDMLPLDLAHDKYEAASTINLPDHALMPGFINAHGHSAMTLFRGLADDLPLMDWLNNHIWPAEGKWVSEAFVEDGTLLAIAEMIRSGTTCFSDMYFFPDVTARVAREHKIRTQICFPVLDFPTPWASNADEYIQKGLNVFDQYKDCDYVSVGFGPHAPYTVSDEPLQQIVTMANQIDASVQIHLHETAFEVMDAAEKTGVRPIQRLAALGLLSPQLQCVHMTQLTDDEISLLADAGAHVVHCPESNLKLASGYCPVDKLLKAGVNVALGTDGAASNNNLDMLGELRTAALLAKTVANDAAAVAAHTALEMATINGARAMGLDDKIGSLAPGKFADMIAIDLSAIECQPIYDPVSHIVYVTNASQISHSWIGGELHMENRQLKMIDTVHLRQKARNWAAKIRQNQGHV